MNNKTLIHSSVLAAIFVAAVIGAGMLTGFPGSGPFITVDPICDKNVGDLVTITGTTNLPAGTELMIQVFATSFERQTSDTGEFSGAVGTVDVMSGTGGANTWSMDVDTSVFVPMEYLVNASAFTGDVSNGDFSTGSPFGTTTFTVNPGSGNADMSRHSDMASAGGFLIDPIRDTTAGKLLEVTGGTNLSAGTNLLVRVVPVITENGKLTGDYQHPENVVLAKVVKGPGVNNRFSVNLDTRSLPVTDHIVTVSNIKGNTAGIGSEPGVFTASQIVNILPGTTNTSDPNYNMTLPAIFINPVDDVTSGDFLTVTGTTNVPAGAKFKVSVVPAENPDFKHPEIDTTTSAVKGSGKANLFSITLQTKALPPGQHIVAVSAYDYETTGSILFTVN